MFIPVSSSFPCFLYANFCLRKIFGKQQQKKTHVQIYRIHKIREIQNRFRKHTRNFLSTVFNQKSEEKVTPRIQSFHESWAVLFHFLLH